MKLLYKGKTKDVYALDKGRVLLIFKDDVTGKDGVFDPGANTVGLRIKGMGQANLHMSAYLFNLLTKAGIQSHFESFDPDRGSMVVKAVSPFGQGLELICRRKAVGSFIRRYGAYIKEGADLDNYVEFTLKDDERGDPLITREGLLALNILTEAQYQQLVDLTRRITGLIAGELAGKGLVLYDIKLEFGLYEGQVLLMDELSAGNMRVYQEGRVLEPLALSQLVLS